MHVDADADADIDLLHAIDFDVGDDSEVFLLIPMKTLSSVLTLNSSLVVLHPSLLRTSSFSYNFSKPFLLKIVPQDREMGRHSNLGLDAEVNKFSSCRCHVAPINFQLYFIIYPYL